MKKHEKKRLNAIKFQQKIAKTKKHLKSTLESRETSSVETFVDAVNKLSTGDLKVITTHPDKFAVYGYENPGDLIRLAQTVIVERSLTLN